MVTIATMCGLGSTLTHCAQSRTIFPCLELDIQHSCSEYGCQKSITQQTRDLGADYVLAVTQNQKPLHIQLVETCACARAENFADCPHDYACTVGKDHGRIETRRCWAIGGVDYCRSVDPAQEWPGLQSLIWLEATLRMGDTVSTETRYCISSRPSRCWRPCGAIGALKIPCIGSWTWLSGKMTAASVQPTPPTTCLLCAGDPLVGI